MPRLAAATRATRSLIPKSMSSLPFEIEGGAVARPYRRALGIIGRTPLLTRGLLPRFARRATGFNQLHRILIINNLRLRSFRKHFRQPLDLISHAASASQAANYSSFIVCDREFVER